MQKAHDASKNNWWENLPSIATPIVAEELNRNETSVDAIDDRVVTFDTTKANQTDLLLAVKSISFDKNTGIFTITKFNNTSTTIDTDIEKIAINFDYDDDPTSPHYQNLVITLDDGTVKYVDMSALVTQYDFSDSAQIHFTNTSGIISATIINGSITEEKLQPNFLADCRAAKTAAETAEANAQSSEDEANAWANGEIDGVPVPSTHPAYHNNAKYYKDLANPTSLMALTDTDITNPASGDVLTFNGEKWENKEGISGEEKTATDFFETINGGLLSECKVALSPNQDLHGYDHPWVGGAGKNKLQVTAYSRTMSGVTFTVNEDGTVLANGTATGNINFRVNEVYDIPAGNYILSDGIQNNSNNINLTTYKNNTWVAATIVQDNVEFQVDSDGDIRQVIYIANGTTVNNLLFKPMIRLATESDPTFEPYSNICPISGHTQVDVDVSDGQTTQEQVTVNLGGTYYSGTLDVVSGVFVPNMVEKDMGDITYNYNSTENIFGTELISDMADPIPTKVQLRCSALNALTPKDIAGIKNADDNSIAFNSTTVKFMRIKCTSYTDGNALKTAMTGQKIVYELANPTPIQLSPTMVKALVGENHLSAPLEGQEIVESKYNSIAKWNDVVQDDITSLETTWSSNKINTDIGTVASSVTALATRVGTNETNIAGLTTRVGTLETNASKITWSNSVNALVDDTTVTISDSNITTASIIEPFYSNASGDNVVIKNQTATAGQVVLTFDALLESTSFRVRITNL